MRYWIGSCGSYCSGIVTSLPALYYGVSEDMIHRLSRPIIHPNVLRVCEELDNYGMQMLYEKNNFVKICGNELSGHK